MTKLTSNMRAIVVAMVVMAGLIGISVMLYDHYLAPTKILIVNALPAQAADIRYNNDNSHIEVECVAMDDERCFSDYDAIVLYGRGLYLDSLHSIEIADAAARGCPIFLNARYDDGYGIKSNLDSVQNATLRSYFQNPCHANYKNALRYLRIIATPERLGDMDCDAPLDMPKNMYYHMAAGHYFKTSDSLVECLKNNHLYVDEGPSVALISGVTFPVEGNRAHIDSLICKLTKMGYNVFPMSSSGRARKEMLESLGPDAIVYIPMGRLGDDDFIDWIYDNDIPLFSPFPLQQARDEWLDVNRPLSGGTLTARVVIPEIDGAMNPICLATQSIADEGFSSYVVEQERMDAFVEQFDRFMALKRKKNADKRVAICYFKSPGKDALLASGMEVIPSLYQFLLRLRDEGYQVSDLPDEKTFESQIMSRGSVMGDYASAAQKNFMDNANPIWIGKTDYESWAKDALLDRKYDEVVERYGEAPGLLLSRGDSLAVAALRYGNILLFPQPRPAIGDDDFRLIHGAEVAPPHSYISAYLYAANGFDADAFIHFGTHGNLEFTPGKNVALSESDWAEALLSNRPNFYFYSVGNVSEAMIAKRRSRAVIVSHLTPPYVESGMHTKYADLIEKVHAAMVDDNKNDMSLKRQIMSLGIHRDLRLDSAENVALSSTDLKRIDDFIEELANEKITGAFYVMGRPYESVDMVNTVMAISVDKLAYEMASDDRLSGNITDEQLHDYSFVNRNYVPRARKKIAKTLASYGDNSVASDSILNYILGIRQKLTVSPKSEFDAMLGLLDGNPVHPTPGGDPILNSNVLPTGRNMYSVNVESTPDEKAWNDGKMLAEKTLSDYVEIHGVYPRKVSFSFWAGEFISTGGATLAQAFGMLGVEPVRDSQGRVIDLKLIPSHQLRRPRIDVLVQVSGQLRDIAASRLKLLTDAVRLASESTDDEYPNFVAEGSKNQERMLVEKSLSPKRARELSVMRVFGPINSGYSTGMLSYVENSGEWNDASELIGGYINNMGAMYGDDENWGKVDEGVFETSISGTDVIVQPRQSNTWGPISLDHVYEFSGSLSLAVSGIDGKEPDVVMADYRNARLPRIQNLNDAIAIEMRSTWLNPTFVKERMKGSGSTAQAFGEAFRNIFGWSVTRSSALTSDVYDELYSLYVNDDCQLGITEYFSRVNPTALQEMTATMIESARKGYWHATDEQLKSTMDLHVELIADKGAPCTEFVCSNRKLQKYICTTLGSDASKRYSDAMDKVVNNDGAITMKRESDKSDLTVTSRHVMLCVFTIIFVVFSAFVFVVRRIRKRKSSFY